MRDSDDSETALPSSLRCPISLELMRDPVILCTGITYDRCAIEEWLDAGNSSCPVTKQRLENTDLIPNHALRKHIQNWCQRVGIDRIPSPKTPPSASEIEEVVNGVAEGDPSAVRRLAALVCESARVRRNVAAGSAPEVLAALLAEKSRTLAGDALDGSFYLLATLAPLPEAARTVLLSRKTTEILVWAVRNGNRETKSNAVMVLCDLAESASGELTAQGLAEAIVVFLSEQNGYGNSLPALKAAANCLLAVSRRKEARLEAINAGAVGLILELLADASDRSVCGLLLAVLNSLVASTEGRSAAYSHALAVPVVVKKLLRVSDAGCELAVGVLWRLCQNSSEEEILDEVIHVGGFQKLLVMMQLGRCTQKCRQMASELLKILHSRGSVENSGCLSRTLALPHVRRSF